MSNDKYLQCYLELDDDWPLSLVSINTQKGDTMFTSIQMFEIFFPDKSHEDFIAWRHHRTLKDWQDDIYCMNDVEFQYHWPLIAGALAEVNTSS